MSCKKNKQNKVIYSILNITENTKEKECISADKKNEKKYRETIEKLGNTTKYWENTGVTFNTDVPPPPNPNNYERLLDFKKKNVLRPVIKQSEATIYLYKKGYRLSIDYEAFEAIETAEKLKDYEAESKQKVQKKMFLPQVADNLFYQHNLENKSSSESDEEIDLDNLNFNKNTKRNSLIQHNNNQEENNDNTSFLGKFRSRSRSKSQSNKKINKYPSLPKINNEEFTFPHPQYQFQSQSCTSPMQMNFQPQSQSCTSPTQMNFQQNYQSRSSPMPNNPQPSAPPMPNSTKNSKYYESSRGLSYSSI